MKRFLDEYTLGKILIFKQDSKKWLPKMLEHVDASQIPKYFGGTQTDEDGDPRCLHKVTKTKLYGKRQMELFFTILKEEKRKRKKKNDNSVHHTQSTVSQCVCVCTFSTFIIMYVKICNKIF